MKAILVSLTLVLIISCNEERKVIHSNKSSVDINVNGQSLDWTISPEVHPDRLEVYCLKDKNQIKIKTDVDSAVFVIKRNDTIKFQFILNSKDTAFTEIIGIKDLPNRISTYDKTYWFSQIWSELKYNFANADRLKFNLDSLYKSFIPIVEETKNDYEYYRTMQMFMARMHDGHTQVGADFSSYMDYFPMRLMDFDKKVYITSVRKIPECDSTWLGAEVVEIEGIPTLQYLEKNIFPYVSASTEQSLWMQGVLRLHSDLKDHPFTAVIRNNDGDLVKINLQRNGEARTPNDRSWGPKISSSGDIVKLTWLKDDIGLISFNRFLPEKKAITEFDKIAKKLDKAKGVIIDLRRNGGGSSEVALHLQKYLTKSNQFKSFGGEMRINDSYGKAQGNYRDEYRNYFLNKAYRSENPIIISVPDTIRRIKCPIVILIGRYTFSAAEDFLVNIYEVPDRPKLIGEETGGSSGAPLFIPGLPGDGFIRICALRICYPISGKPFVNSGIKPDIEVKQSIEDYLNSKDVVLERAIAELKK